jgi:membrane protein required for colicin V production
LLLFFLSWLAGIIAYYPHQSAGPGAGGLNRLMESGLLACGLVLVTVLVLVVGLEDMPRQPMEECGIGRSIRIIGLCH